MTRQGVDRVYCYLIQLYVVAILVEVFLVGVGVFGDHVSTVANSSSFDSHRMLAAILGVVAVNLFLFALLARPSWAIVIQPFVLAALAESAQPALANAGDSKKWVGGFNSLDGMLILLLSLWMAVHAYRRQDSRRPASQGGAGS